MMGNAAKLGSSRSRCRKAAGSPGSALRSISLSIDPQPLILEGLKRLDEWPIIQTHVRTGNEIFAPTGVQPDLSDGEEREVYALIDGRTPVCDLYQRTTIGRFPCARTIFNLITAGVIRPLSVEELLALGHVERARQILERFANSYGMAKQCCGDLDDWQAFYSIHLLRYLRGFLLVLLCSAGVTRAEVWPVFFGTGGPGAKGIYRATFNTASGQYSAVPGGYRNTAGGAGSLAAGVQATAST